MVLLGTQKPCHMAQLHAESSIQVRRGWEGKTFVFFTFTGFSTGLLEYWNKLGPIISKDMGGRWGNVSSNAACVRIVNLIRVDTIIILPLFQNFLLVLLVFTDYTVISSDQLAKDTRNGRVLMI